jgi:uncharacterized protein YcfJ
MQDKDTYATTERQCKTVGEKVVGYDVDYRLNGHTRTIRMDHGRSDTGQRRQTGADRGRR